MLEFDEKNHVYWLVEGGKRERLVSVTTALKVLSRAWPDTEKARQARWLGTAVHLMTEYFDEGVLDESKLDPALVPYLNAYKRFHAKHNAKWHVIEQRSYHPTFKYAGTIDREGELDGQSVMLDIKTGSPYSTHPLQLSAYCQLMQTEDRIESGYARVALYLSPEKYRLTYFPREDARRDWRVFLAALTVYQWREREGING